MFSLMCDLNDIRNTVQDIRETVQDIRNPQPDNHASFGLIGVVGGLIIAALFLFGMFSMIGSMDAERAESAAAPAEHAQKPVDCRKNPWGIGCPR